MLFDRGVLLFVKVLTFMPSEGIWCWLCLWGMVARLKKAFWW